MNDHIGSSDVRPEEMFVMGDWVRLLTDQSARSTDRRVSEPKRHSCDVPFSFACGARSSREWLKLENATRECGEWQNDKRLHFLRWRDSEAGLSCVMELTEFRDFPAMDSRSEAAAPILLWRSHP